MCKFKGRLSLGLATGTGMVPECNGPLSGGLWSCSNIRLPPCENGDGVNGVPDVLQWNSGDR